MKINIDHDEKLNVIIDYNGMEIADITIQVSAIMINAKEPRNSQVNLIAYLNQYQEEDVTVEFMNKDVDE